MDADAATLLTTAETTVAGLMATDAWQQIRDGLVRLWRRYRPEQAEAVGRELTASHEVIAARRSADVEHGQQEVALGPLWERELRVLASDPQAMQDLVALLRSFAEMREASPTGQALKTTTEVAAKAKGRARAYAAGRDMIITERPSDDS